MRRGTQPIDPALLGLLVHSCAEKLPLDEQVSKNLFGPPLESAFDHEDFTGDGNRGVGVASERMGGAIARIGQVEGRWGQWEDRLVCARVSRAIEDGDLCVNGRGHQ